MDRQDVKDTSGLNVNIRGRHCKAVTSSAPSFPIGFHDVTLYQIIIRLPELQTLKWHSARVNTDPYLQLQPIIWAELHTVCILYQ